MAGRNSEKGSAVAEKVGGIFMHVDTSDMDSVRIFCSEFISQYQRLDVLMCNAAIMAPGEPDKTAASKRTKEGWECDNCDTFLELPDTICVEKKSIDATDLIDMTGVKLDFCSMNIEFIEPETELEINARRYSFDFFFSFPTFFNYTQFTLIPIFNYNFR